MPLREHKILKENGVYHQRVFGELQLNMLAILTLDFQRQVLACYVLQLLQIFGHRQK